MGYKTVFSSEYISITQRPDGFYIESFKNGMSLDQFNKIIEQHPEIKITNFLDLKNCLMFAPKLPVKFGDAIDRIVIDVSNDELKAYVTIHVCEEELTGDTRISLVNEILMNLSNNKIVFGIKHEVLVNQLKNNIKTLIAEGISAINGTDSEIHLYELKDAKPETKEDNNVDYYELDLINKVASGDWLGERIEPTSGTPGKTVHGNVIIPQPGKKYPLYYDKDSVKEVQEGGVTTLYALRNGAVYYEGERIGVSNHLEITGNVDFKTGNIDFDGYLTVKGSIEDNFTVTANKDVEILGDYGVGSIREIMSREGSVFIKGGIAGRNKAVVKSKKNIFAKFISDTTIICDGTVHIGYYCLNSDITAKQVIIDSPKGQIIGGTINAEIKVVSSIIGSPGEKRTLIKVSGFDRNELRKKLEDAVYTVDVCKNHLTKCKQEIAIYTNASELSRAQSRAYEVLKEKYFSLRNNLKLLEEEKKNLVSYLKTLGEGEISILKKSYPNSVLEIKKLLKETKSETLGVRYYVQDGELKEI